jgi:flavin reductase (DIM6/NTAB) family NADH-FMN oxidoreductase RutF
VRPYPAPQAWEDYLLTTRGAPYAMDPDEVIHLDLGERIWNRVFQVAPLVVIGTKEGDGYDLAPKHLAMPLGWHNYFGFVCTPAHRTYHNAIAAGAFTVSFPRPDQLAVASLTASPRAEDTGSKEPLLSQLPTRRASRVDGIVLQGAYLTLECALDRVVEDLGENGLLIGRIVAAMARREALRVSDGDDQQLVYEHPLLVYLHPGRYAEIRESMSFPFPADMTA